MARIVDLTVELRDGLSTYPGGPKMAVMNRITHEWSAPRYLPPAAGAADRIVLLNEHIGTHVDAPFHFLKDGETIEALPPDRFCGTAVLADISTRDPAAPVTAAQIEAALAARGEAVRPGDMLLVRCWAGDRDDPGFVRAAALTPDAGAWAVAQRVKALGVDLPSVDSPGDRSFPVHMTLLSARVLIYENLANLGRVEASRFTFFGLPLRLAGATGSPVRAVALVE